MHGFAVRITLPMRKRSIQQRCAWCTPKTAGTNDQVISSGLLLLSVGALRLSNPIRSYSKNSGIKIENEVNLLNEVRGTSSLMFFGGATILSGIIIPQLTFSSFVVATLFFFGFAFGRLLSVRLDGRPNKLIIRGLMSELVLGSLSIFGLFKNLA